MKVSEVGKEALKDFYLLIMFFLVLTPFASIFYRALTTRTAWGTFFSGLKYYFEIPLGYWISLRNSLLVGGATALVDFVVALPVAYVISRYKFPGRKLLATMFIVPMFTPDVVAGIGLMLAYYLNYGLYGTWLGTILGLASISYPMMLIPLAVSIKVLDPVYEEAALTLGANPLQVLFKVVLPLIGPGIYAGFFLTFVWSINDYLLPLFITGPGLDLMATKLYSDVRWWGLLGRVAAEASLLQLVSFGVMLIYLKTVGKKLGGFAF